MRNLNVLKTFGAAILLVALCCAATFAQAKTDLETIVETENAFARFADEKGVKRAFLEFLTDDALMFNPQVVNGKELWLARPDNSPATLAWYPTFADVSSNGALAYTIGEGAYRPKGKSDQTVYYSTYLTVWRKMPDGKYKAALDVGISHDKPPVEDKNWTSPKSSEKSLGKYFAADWINKFFDVATTEGLTEAYKIYVAEDARFLREGKFPILGKRAALGETKTKSKITFGKQMTQISAGDLAYVVTTYELRTGEKLTGRGNIIQVWKSIGMKWQIVADVFAPIPLEQKQN